MKRLVPSALLITALIALAGCSAAEGPLQTGKPTKALETRTPKPTERSPASCTVPAQAFIDLVACVGDFEVFEDEMAATRDGKSLARIAVASQDAKAILAAMGEEAVQLPRR